MIPFNKSYLTGREAGYIKNVLESGKLSGNGRYTQLCQEYFEKRYGFRKCLLTTSGTTALEMAAMLIDIAPGDEVIVPSYTFVSTANAFVLRGAKIVFADSSPTHPNIDVDLIEGLITTKTKAIVVVHYAGMACDMDKVMEVAQRHGLWVIEDAAQAIDSYYKERTLGSIGHLAAFSFHETKNIISGEGGMLVVNDERFVSRAEIIWEKGTNRAAFFRGEVDKYNWWDIGSSCLPSEMIAAFLYAQVEQLDSIQKRRCEIWDEYYLSLLPLVEKGKIKLPQVPQHATKNGHLFYILCNDFEERQKLIKFLKDKEIDAVFHYVPLHSSPYYNDQHGVRPLPYATYYSDVLVRLPLFCELGKSTQEQIVTAVNTFYL